MDYIERNGIKYKKVECESTLDQIKATHPNMIPVIAECEDHELAFLDRNKAAKYFKVGVGCIKLTANNKKKTHGYILRNGSINELRSFTYNKLYRAWYKKKINKISS